jgi:hypothetical protein
MTPMFTMMMKGVKNFPEVPSEPELVPKQRLLTKIGTKYTQTMVILSDNYKVVTVFTPKFMDIN